MCGQQYVATNEIGVSNAKFVHYKNSIQQIKTPDRLFTCRVAS